MPILTPSPEQSLTMEGDALHTLLELGMDECATLAAYVERAEELREQADSANGGDRHDRQRLATFQATYQRFRMLNRANSAPTHARTGDLNSCGDFLSWVAENPAAITDSAWEALSLAFTTAARTTDYDDSCS